jgi:hypothetical protein
MAWTREDLKAFSKTLLLAYATSYPDMLLVRRLASEPGPLGKEVRNKLKGQVLREQVRASFDSLQTALDTESDFQQFFANFQALLSQAQIPPKA